MNREHASNGVDGRGLVLALALLVPGTAVSAQVIQVPQDQPTIQDAVDAAGSGATISVSSGTYVENVVVPVSKGGLSIIGKGKVFIDGQMGDVGVFINANNVTLRNLTLRHAAGEGVAAFVENEGGLFLTGVTLDRVTIINSARIAILFGIDGAGILVTGLDFTISRNQVSETGEESVGIFATSAGSGLVEQNLVDQAIAYGYALFLSDGTVSRNQAHACGTEGDGGFFILGDGNTIDGNRAEDCEADGFRIRGSTNTISGNKATGCMVNGIVIESSPPPEGGDVSLSNLLSGNSCSGNQGQGLQNQGVATQISKNRLTKNRQDLTNTTSQGATLVDEGDNKFQTGGLTTEPEITDN